MKHLILVQLLSLRNRILRLTLFDQSKIALFMFIAALFLTGIYAGSWRLLSYLDKVPIIGPSLTGKLLGLIFLTSFSMVVFSGLVTSFNTIFSSSDLPWLMTKPIHIRQIFIFKSLATCFHASWMVVVLLAPLLLAMGQIKKAPWDFYLFSFALLIPYLLIASMCGILIALVLMRFFPSRRTRDILFLLGILIVTVFYALFRFIEPERLVKPDGLEVVAQYLSFLNAPTAAYLPSWWLTRGIFGFLSASAPDGIFYTIMLYAVAVIALVVVIAIAGKFYFEGWAEGQVYHSRLKKDKAFRYISRGPFGALLEKDARIFFRDMNQWSQLILLGTLVMVYLFSISKLPLDTMYIQNLIAFFNIILIGIILAAVALRFVFPLVSIEGRGLDMLRSSPLRLSGVLFEKLFFGGIPLAGFGVVMAVSSALLLKVDTEIFILTLSAVIIMAVGMSTMAVGFGSMFARFDYTNIAQIESSGGGLFFIISAIFYVGINISLWAIPVQSFYQKKFLSQRIAEGYGAWIAAGLILINIIAIVIPMWLGRRSLERAER